MTRAFWLLLLLSGCSPGWRLEGDAEARAQIAGRHHGGTVATNPTNLFLDTTAHPSNGGNLTAFYDHSGGAAQNIVTPSFSTTSGAHLIMVGIYADGSAAPFGSGSTIQDNFGLGTTWTLKVDKTDSLHEYGSQIWEAYVNGAISSKTLTFHTPSSSTGQKMSMLALIVNGVPATEAGSLGNQGGFIDLAGTPTLTNATVNVAASKSWIFVACQQSNGDAAVLTADSNTTPWDQAAQVGTGGGNADYAAFGRFRSVGAVQATAGSGNVTVGAAASTPNPSFASCAALEIKSS